MGNTSDAGGWTAQPEPEHLEKRVAQEDLDVGAAYAAAARDSPPSPEESSALRRRIDRRVMPILFFNVILASVDKVSTSTGALYGMKTDNDLDYGNRYSWIGSAFYFGYLAASIPAAWAMQKYPIAKVIIACQLAWGVLLIGMGFMSSFPGLLVLRILLGMLEAPIIPGGILIMSMWYSRQEISLRLAFYYTGFAQLLTGPVGYAVGQIHDVWFRPWRLFFWLLGAVTVIWAFLIYFLLPDNPVSAKFLSEREKAVAVARLKEDHTGMENKHWKMEQVKEAVYDPKTWLLFAFNIFVAVPNGGLTNFSPLIVQGLGYSAPKAALLNIPCGLLETVASFLCNGTVFLVTRKYGNRFQLRGVAIIFGLVVGMVAAVFLYTLPLNALGARLAMLYIGFFYLGPYIVSLGFITTNTSGYTKKVFLNAVCFVANCVANIIGPQFFIDEQAPRYVLGVGAILGSYALGILTISLYMLYCATENRRRDALYGSQQEADGDADFLDLTDKVNINFRYVW